MGTGKVFKYLTPEAKDVVFRRFMDWFEAARQRGADFYGMAPDVSDLEEMEADCLLAMCEDSADGLDNFWARTAPEPPEAEPPPDRGGDTGGRSQTTSDSVRQSETAPDSARTSQAANNQSINQSIEESIDSRIKLFPPPTLEEITEFFRQQQLSIDPLKFFNYYEATGWMMKGAPIKSWKAAARTWEANEKKGDKENGIDSRQGNDLAGDGSICIRTEKELYDLVSF